MAASYNDGTVQYGSLSLYVLQNDGTTPRDSDPYTFDNFTVNRPTKAIDRTNNLAEPSGSVGIADFVTASGQVQVIDGVAKIQIGDRIFFDGEAGSNAHLLGTTDEKFFVTSVSETLPKDGEQKQNITLKKQYGA